VPDSPDPRPGPELRASDADREQIADRLRDAAADGSITLDELSDRLELALTAKTFGELDACTRDLPQRAAAATLASPAALGASSLVGGAPGRKRRSIALLGGVERGGRWVVPARYTATAVLGSVELDLRRVTFAEAETVIHASALLGSVDIIVPEGVIVHVSGIGLVGRYDDCQDHGVADIPVNAPVLRVVGATVLGSVDVEVKPPPQQQAPTQGLWRVLSKLRIRIR